MSHPDRQVLSFQNLSYRYPESSQNTLTDINLSITEGEMVLVTGASGSGKSTLLKAACGLVPHFYGGEISGSARIGTLDTKTHKPVDLAAAVGVVLQDPESQTVMGTVSSELSLPAENAGLSPSAVARAVEEIALALGIQQLLDRPTDQLSGGELQRVAVAAALINRPPLLVLDEPTSQLDPVAADELIWLLRRLNEEWGVAILMIEHRLERCIAACDRVVVLKQGAVVQDSTPESFLTWAAEQASDLQTPTARLFSDLELTPAPVSVKQASSALKRAGYLPLQSHGQRLEQSEQPRGVRTLKAKGLWHQLKAGPTLLRAVDLELTAGESVALIGRNGAGKSTLLRHLAEVQQPTRGRLKTSGRFALLMQNPSDYLIHDRVDKQASSKTLALVGLADRYQSHPNQLSGGERQRLALATVIDGQRPVGIMLDEPTRGMDRGHKKELLKLLTGLAREGVTLVVATHDMEFVAEYAQRVVMLGAQGTVLADDEPQAILSEGLYFTTEIARLFSGDEVPLLPHQAAELLLNGGSSIGQLVATEAAHV